MSIALAGTVDLSIALTGTVDIFVESGELYLLDFSDERMSMYLGAI